MLGDVCDTVKNHAILAEKANRISRFHGWDSNRERLEYISDVALPNSLLCPLRQTKKVSRCTAWVHSTVFSDVIKICVSRAVYVFVVYLTTNIVWSVKMNGSEPFCVE